MMNMRTSYIKALALLVLVLLTGCLDSTYSRGLFQGYVMDQAPEIVKGKVGKPVTEDAVGNSMKWVYKKKTFDPDNMNAFDSQTTITFEKDVKGNFKVFSVDFTS